MLYVGNFNYNDNQDDADNYCLMPAVVEAENAEEALDKFQEMFERIHSSSDLLDGAHKIYLDSLVEFNQTPQEATLVQWQKIVPEVDGLCSITSTLPEAQAANTAAAYDWNDEDEQDLRNSEDEQQESADEEQDFDEEHEEEEEPFLML